MKIVIIGDGKVGYKLAKQLSEENHEIVMIDDDEERLRYAINRLDINCVPGDAVDAAVQEDAGVPDADLVIACASTDELNMLSCLIARRLGAENTIARVRNPIYFRQMHLLQEDLHLSMAINPELTVAREITRVLIFPSAVKAETFVKGRVELVEVPVTEGNPIIGRSLADTYKKSQVKILVCAVQRGGEVIIPDGSFAVQKGDKLHIAATHKELELLFKIMGGSKKKIRKVLIGGGGRVSYYLARQLSDMGMEIKIIESDRAKCEKLCEQLPKVTVICGDATDHELLTEEGIGYADAFIALTGVDEENIITALFAKAQGVGKIIAKVNEDSRAAMVESFGLDCLVSAKTATTNAILSYVRARQNSYSSANIETMYRLVEDKVEALEFLINEDSDYTGIPLKDLVMKKNTLIACIGRGRQIIIPSGNDCILKGDSVVVVTAGQGVRDITDILAQR